MWANGTSTCVYRTDSRIEATCYFLASPDSANNEHAEEFERCIQELVDMIEAFQKPDGYLDIYFSVVDTEGRFRNFRDMHEMCEFHLGRRELT
jgi:DUF1680 family protein